jgi:RsiW-degrading membrane proteinase PrsW (M82 family)
MAIKFSCPGCEKRLQAPEKMAGKSATCPQCATRVSIPQLAPEFDPDSFFEEFKKPAPAPPPVEPDREAPPAKKPKSVRNDSPSHTSGAAGDDFLSGMDLADSEHPVVKSERRKRKVEAEDGLDSLEDFEEPAEDLPSMPKPRRKKSRSETEAAQYSASLNNESSEDEVSPLRQNLYWFLLVALIPLCISIFSSKDDLKERLISTLQKHPELAPMMENLGLEELMQRLPDHKLDGAWLARDSMLHWGLALLSAVAFTALITILFRTRRTPPWELLWRGVFIGSIGILLLLAFQYIAEFSLGLHFRRAHAVILLVLYLIKFIGFSYSCAMNPENGFFLSFVGFTCGVGLCEELCKAMLLLGHYRSSGKPAGWGTACAWGLACGAGFGVSEGIMYSGEYYNGLSGMTIYAVRFISCVALHAIWSGIAAILLYRSRDVLQGHMEWGEILAVLFNCLGGVIVLHGLYDTFLKREMDIFALLTALGSFGWLAFLIQQLRARTKKA